MQISDKCCGTCKHWLKTEVIDGKSLGVCRESPPQLVVVKNKINSLFPTVFDFGVCGRHAEK